MLTFGPMFLTIKVLASFNKYEAGTQHVLGLAPQGSHSSLEFLGYLLSWFWLTTTHARAFAVLPISGWVLLRLGIEVGICGGNFFKCFIIFKMSVIALSRWASTLGISFKVFGAGTFYSPVWRLNC